MSILEHAARPTTMTTEEMLSLPEDGLDRELIRGELRATPVTHRNPRHSRSTSRIAHLLEQWLERRPEPRGQIVGGEGGFRLRRNPDSLVGIDVAYVSAEVVAGTPETLPYFEGPPVLAVEILSPSDTHARVTEKIDLYHECEVPVVWIVDPRYKTVTVYRRGGEPELFNLTGKLVGGPEMPGLRIPVAEFFR